ncbi:MAG: HNH endonuclease signature motif containing protein [Pseudomonadota bacterium]
MSNIPSESYKDNLMRPFTADEAKKVISYNPITGIFTRLVPCCNHKTIMKKLGADNHGYLIILLLGKRVRAHRLAYLIMTGDWPDGILDHANGVCSDNRWENIRFATYSQNHMNKKSKRGLSGYRGVVKARNGNWQAKLTVNKIVHSLGVYECPKAASDVVEAFAKEKFGKFYTENGDRNAN